MMIKSLEKGLRVLSYLATKPSAGPSEISRDLRYGKSNVVRLLQTMKASGYVRQDADTGRYQIGTEALQLSHSFLEQQDDIVSMAADQIQALWSTYSETVGLSVRNGDSRICIYRRQSPMELRHSVTVGQVLPLHLGAAGKTLMAYMDPDEVEALLVRLRVGPDHATLLRHELSEIRQTGIAYAFGEREPGIAGVAAPILNGRKEPLAALFLTGPVERMTFARLHEMAGPLAIAAQTVSGKVVA